MLKTLVFIVTEMVSNIASFVWEFLDFAFAPVVLFVLMLISGSVFHDNGAYTLHAVISVLCAIGMIVSFVRCHDEFGFKGKVIILVLCLVSVTMAYSEVKGLEEAPVSGSTGYSTVSFTGKPQCSGCFGRGYVFCKAANCSGGKCTACTYGSYNHGTYRSDCRVCGGDGLCNRCDGTNKVACKVCD